MFLRINTCDYVRLRFQGNGGLALIECLKAKKLKTMSAFVDNALKVFGTPERELRRRWLHPFRFAQEETDDGDKQDEDSTVKLSYKSGGS